jgi:hypothetical protein
MSKGRATLQIFGTPSEPCDCGVLREAPELARHFV